MLAYLVLLAAIFLGLYQRRLLLFMAVVSAPLYVLRMRFLLPFEWGYLPTTLLELLVWGYIFSSIKELLKQKDIAIPVPSSDGVDSSVNPICSPCYVELAEMEPAGSRLASKPSYFKQIVKKGHLAITLWYQSQTVLVLFFLFSGLLAVVVAPDKWAAAGIFRAYFLQPICLFFVLIKEFE
ncbi:MAG TPA: hypothetical protein ENN77_00490, partial [Candidatus Wirthbacteria bacterium]|nr:hypothetical protein [Candidatus Wirthbacteria bacterium]